MQLLKIKNYVISTEACSGHERRLGIQEKIYEMK